MKDTFIMFTSLTPNLMVNDIHETVAFYCDVLGFSLRMAVPEDKSEFPNKLKQGVHYIYAQLVYGDVEIMIQTRDSLAEDLPVMAGLETGASISFYGKVDNINQLFDNLKDKTDIVKAIETSWYGMREFYVRDPNGYILGFAEPDPDAQMG